MKRVGLTLMEEVFCQLVACGTSGVEAYSQAFGKPILDERRRRLYTKRASNLANRSDIAVRIDEAKGEQKRRDRELWQQRGDDIANRLHRRIIEADNAGKMLTPGTLKGLDVLAKLKGMYAPEERVLKDGGLADSFVPRGIETAKESDLKAIIENSEDDVFDVGEE